MGEVVNMATLLLKRKGIIVTRKQQEDQWAEKEANKDTVLSLLKFRIDLEEGYTLRDWFTMIINYPCLQAIDMFFESFIEEFNNCPKSGCYNSNMPFIKLSKIISIENSVANIRNDVTGEPNWGLDFTQLNTYVDTPLKLEEIHLCEHDEVKKYETDYTLWDIVQSIIWELSFYGTPEERDMRCKEMYDWGRETNIINKQT